MVCSRTLYNMVWRGCLPIHPTELPEALKRKTKKHRVRENKKRYGASISDRPEIASLRLEEGHWEGDTVVGRRSGKESVVFSLLEKKTENKEEDAKRKGTYLRREFSYTQFQQSLLLPDNIERENISAKVENGVMTIDIPKKKIEETAAATRQIEVK